MKEKLKQNSNGWYAVVGSWAVFFLLLLEHFDNVFYIPVLFFALTGAFISIGTLFCGSRRQRDGLFCGLFFSHIFILIVVIMLPMVYEEGIVMLPVPLFAYIISLVMDAVYEGVGNARDKKAKLATKKTVKKAKRK